MRLIDADELLTAFPSDDEPTLTKSCVRMTIQHMPTIEQPVRMKGKWIETEVLPKAFDVNGIGTWASKMQCDQCEFITYAIEGRMGQYNFCPNCGARMSEGEGDDCK